MALIVALSILHKSLQPLKNLQRASKKIIEGDFSTISENGFPEISTPIKSFNQMVGQVETLINDLQSEVDNHEITEVKLRNAIGQAKDHSATVEQQKNFLKMTLQSIVDGVITTDINGNVTSINPIAEQLTGWPYEEANGKPIGIVMHALNEKSRKRINDPIENIENRSVLDDSISTILVQQGSNVETPVEYIAAPMRNREDEIVGSVIIIHDESAQRSLNRQLSFQATHDALTGLINRYEFERKLKSLLATAGSDSVPNTLCYMDLDQFKLINDTCGHTAGDTLLKDITALLDKNLRDEDTLARLGGDEFGILFENCDVEHGEFLAGEIIRVVENYNFEWKGSNYKVNASIGIVAITSDMRTSDDLLRNADSACNFAKESGRNRLQIYTQEDDKLLTQQREMHWVSRIHHALEEDRFELYFQQIKPLQGSSAQFMHHGEILLRLHDKQGNIVSPGTFLPAAERYNLITMIDEWVVDQAFNWISTSKKNIQLSINLSGKSISNKDFLNYVVSKIKKTLINPELICFEITETAAISHLSTAIHFMNALKKLGCTFALDDFGSGLSSFSYLSSLPVDYLKIDGTFVVDIDKDPMHYAMVNSINEVGHVMGIKTIAEYAASQNIINCLKDIGVDYIQGYAVARPIPLSTFDENISNEENFNDDDESPQMTIV